MLPFSLHGSSHGSESEELNWLNTWKTCYKKWEPGPKSRRETCDEMIRQYKDTDGQKKKTKK